MDETVSRLFLVGILGVVSIAVGIVLYLYRLERIPKLPLSQVLGLLLFCRVLDAGSFWWILRSSGGEAIQGEINLFFHLLVSFLPKDAALVLSFIPTTMAAVAVVLFYYRFLLWGGATIPQARRFALVAAAAMSVMSLFGMATNLAFLAFGWQSPLLISIG